MENQVAQIAARIKGLRLLLDLTPEEVAEAAGVSVEEYLASEEGNSDFSFTFLFKCAKCFGVDISELVVGESPETVFLHGCPKRTGRCRLNAEKGLPTIIWEHS